MPVFESDSIPRESSYYQRSADLRYHTFRQFVIPFCIHFRDSSIGMAENHLCGLQSEFLPDVRGCGVSQLVGRVM